MSIKNPQVTAPFFMFGFERSGNTLLAMMLGAHPEIAVPFSVAGLWYRYGDRLPEYDNIATAADLHRLVDDLLADDRIKLWDVNLNPKEVFQGLELANYPAVVQRFHTAYAARTNKRLWGNVDILTLDRMDTARAWFPSARFIHIVRDGRDVSLSHDSYIYGATNTLECAESWRFKVRTNLKMGAMLDSAHYLVVRYEDLVLDPATALGRICEFLGVDYSSLMLNYPDVVQEKIPESRRSLWPLISSRPRADNAYRWKRHMSPTRRVVFERTASSLLDHLGYEIYGRLPKKASSLVFELFCLLDRGHRFRRLARSLTRLGKRRAANGSQSEP